MELEDFDYTLKVIVGGNAVGAQNKTVEKFGKAIWYLKIQTKVMNKIEDMSEREEYRKTIFDNVRQIIGGD